MTEKRKVLGRGLETLLPPRQIPNMPIVPGGSPPSSGESVLEIPLDHLDPNPYQTRTSVDEHALAELCESIAAVGVVEPIIVRPAGNGRYQIIAGERRVRASSMCEKVKIPAVVRQVSDQLAMEMTIVENLLREDVNAMDTAHAFHRLSQEFKLTQEEIAVRTGKDRTSVANFMRLLKLPPEVQKLLREDKLSFGHAKVLLSLPAHSPAVVVDVARRAVNLSVRQTEKLVEESLHPSPPREKKERVVDANVREAEEQLQRALGVRVTINDRNGQGRIVLEYTSLEDFDRIVEALSEG
jgi:ParB family chromosome partitioning protein